MKRRKRKRKSKHYEKLVKGLKRHPEVTNPWALAHYLENEQKAEPIIIVRYRRHK